MNVGYFSQIVSFGDPSYLMGTQYPTQCPSTQNDSYVASPGTYVSFIKTGRRLSYFTQKELEAKTEVEKKERKDGRNTERERGGGKR